jgi:hypothetical protein
VGSGVILAAAALAAGDRRDRMPATTPPLPAEAGSELVA